MCVNTSEMDCVNVAFVYTYAHTYMCVQFDVCLYTHTCVYKLRYPFISYTYTVPISAFISISG